MADRLLPYVHLLRGQLRSQTAYRTSFTLSVVMDAVFTSLDIVAVVALFQVTDSIAGFGFRPALLLTAQVVLAFALADFCVGNVERLDRYVRTGELDTVLVRPLAALGQLLATDIALRRAGRLAQTTAVYVFALVLAGVDWTPGRAVLAVLGPLAGAVIYAALFVATATSSFWLIDAGQVAHAFTYGGRDFGAYPLPVYTGVFRRLFGFGLGLGFVGYYPVLGVLGLRDPLGLPGWTGWLAPLVAAGWVLVAVIAWRAGLRRYNSTGS